MVENLCYFCTAEERDSCRYKYPLERRDEEVARALHCKNLDVLAVERQEIFQLVTERLGGTKVASEDDVNTIKWAVTLPTIDEWARFFRVDKYERITYGNTVNVVLTCSKSPSALYARVDEGNLEFVRVEALKGLGWDTDAAEKGLVYGFAELPTELDRINRVLQNLRTTGSVRYNGVSCPISNVGEHKFIKAINIK